jgi:hypothetical protein
MAYDPISRKVILLDGGSPNGDIPRGDMWAWDGITWNQLHPNTVARQCFTGADAITDRDLGAVIFVACNQTGQPDPGHIWKWTGSDWAYIATTGTPPKSRFGFGFANDQSRHQNLFVGGWNSYERGDVNNDTWLLTGLKWTQLQTTGPSPAGSGQAVYDEERQQILLLMPTECGSPCADQTWTWNGATWTQHHPAHTPPGWLSGNGMAYDPISRQVISFGGKSDQLGSAIINQTWGWNGSDWTQLG